jgi:hypothetical protein
MRADLTLAQFNRLKPDYQKRVLDERRRLLRLCAELDMEMDGVKCPRTAAAILAALRGIVSEYE